MSHEIAITCDNCGEHYSLSVGMDLPPYWFGVQLAIGNYDGNVSDGVEMYNHFCSQECFQEYAGGDEVRYCLAMVDREEEEG